METLKQWLMYLAHTQADDWHRLILFWQILIILFSVWLVLFSFAELARQEWCADREQQGTWAQAGIPRDPFWLPKTDDEIARVRQHGELYFAAAKKHSNPLPYWCWLMVLLCLVVNLYLSDL